MLRNENREKFELTYFRPFRIHRVRAFSTYAIETAPNRILRKLVYSSRLLPYEPDS